jgi:hypothetical protein
MRNMSFALTTQQILDRSKTVTRRVGWNFLKPGDLIQAVEKGQGLKKGEQVKKLAVIRVKDVRREALDAITDGDVVAEGFPEMSPLDFVVMFCASHRLKEWQGWPELRDSTRQCVPTDQVTRIEFEYVD